MPSTFVPALPPEIVNAALAEVPKTMVQALAPIDAINVQIGVFRLSTRPFARPSCSDSGTLGLCAPFVNLILHFGATGAQLLK